jgi:hypothetical protein
MYGSIMKDKNLLAFEVALGLTEDKDNKIDKDLVEQWQKKLPQLNHYAPITKQQSKKIW